MRPNQIRTALPAILAVAVLLLCAAFASGADQADMAAEKKAAQIAKIKAKNVPQELKEPVEKSSAKQETPTVSPTQIAPEKVKPVQRQIEPLSASATDEKGRVIKWQIICTGSGCGNDDVVFTAGYQDVHFLCGTLGQVAVGRGSSPSFGINQGFWQETVTGDYIRGDANTDGVVNVADVVYLVNFLYRSGDAPAPMWCGDANCDEIVNVADVVYLVNYLYRGGDPPSC